MRRRIPPQIMNFFTHRMGFVDDWMVVMDPASDIFFSACVRGPLHGDARGEMGVGEVHITASEI